MSAVRAVIRFVTRVVTGNLRFFRHFIVQEAVEASGGEWRRIDEDAQMWAVAGRRSRKVKVNKKKKRPNICQFKVW